MLLNRLRLFAAVLLFSLLLLLLLSLFYPKIEHIELRFNHQVAHYSPEEILNALSLSEGKPFFWFRRSRLEPLENDPWIAALHVDRRWPNSVLVKVWQRQAYALYKGKVIADDGTELQLRSSDELLRPIVIDGSGPSRLDEALSLLRLLNDFEPKVVNYSPVGFEIVLEYAQVFTQSEYDLKEQWTAFMKNYQASADNSHPNQLLAQGYISVYSWGVSVQ